MIKIKYFLVLFITILCFSCTATKYVEIPVETVKKEYIVDVKHDSICVKDSVFIRALNDTIFMEKWHTKFISKFKTDTVLKIDSVPYIKCIPITKEIKVKETTWYQDILITIGIMSLLLLFIKLIIDKIKSWG